MSDLSCELSSASSSSSFCVHPTPTFGRGCEKNWSILCMRKEEAERQRNGEELRKKKRVSRRKREASRPRGRRRRKDERKERRRPGEAERRRRRAELSLARGLEKRLETCGREGEEREERKKGRRQGDSQSKRRKKRRAKLRFFALTLGAAFSGPLIFDVSSPFYLPLRQISRERKRETAWIGQKQRRNLPLRGKEKRGARKGETTLRPTESRRSL